MPKGEASLRPLYRLRCHPNKGHDGHPNKGHDGHPNKGHLDDSYTGATATII